MPRVPLKGSERTAMRGATAIAPADAGERLEVTVIVRRREPDAINARVAALASDLSTGSYLSREQFAQRHGAEDADLKAVRDFAESNGLTVTQENAARRTIVLSGTVAQFSTAFNVKLERMQHANGTYRGRVGAVELPESLNGIVEAVLGLDNRPQAASHHRVRPAASSLEAFTPNEVASLYAFPRGTGLGQCVALIELGGGFRPKDLEEYFTELKVGLPSVTALSVDHARNAPTGNANGADGEVMLDIEVVGAIAPKAGIVVYFAPNTDAGFLDAVTTAIHDTSNKPSVISISWGGPESDWTPQAMKAMDDAFQAAATMGISVCVASGDNGSGDGVDDGKDHVDFPASSPHVLACGGTRLGAEHGVIASEVTWNDGPQGGSSGGGVSTFFDKPVWQSSLTVARSGGTSGPLARRGVPDVAANADPETGYKVRVDGVATVIGGTSAVAPLWAGLIARTNQLADKSAGLVSPKLYRTRDAFRDIRVGDNGDFAASDGWDACTGLGSPNGGSLGSVV